MVAYPGVESPWLRGPWSRDIGGVNLVELGVLLPSHRYRMWVAAALAALPLTGLTTAAAATVPVLRAGPGGEPEVARTVPDADPPCGAGGSPGLDRSPRFARDKQILRITLAGEQAPG